MIGDHVLDRTAWTMTSAAQEGLPARTLIFSSQHAIHDCLTTRVIGWFHACTLLLAWQCNTSHDGD
jgi:hypothetical protein